jgi:hypothetical protein
MKCFAKGSHITPEAYLEYRAIALVIAASSAVLLDPVFFMDFYQKMSLQIYVLQTIILFEVRTNINGYTGKAQQ